MSILVPHLTTAQSGPLQEIEQRFLDEQAKIETWFRKAWQSTPAPIYSSVDLRNAGFKLAPVDTNLFPAGFNNLNRDFMALCIQAAQVTLEQMFPGCDRLLLIPENHTRNIHYFENLATLQRILIAAGYETRLGSLSPEVTTPLPVELPSGAKLLLEPLQRTADAVHVGDFKPCIVVLNNDLAEGVPEILKNIKQITTPPLTLGWSHRFKSNHFKHYQQVAKEFADTLAIDPWCIDPLFSYCDHVDFQSGEGMTELMQKTEILLQKIREKYQQYQITDKPFIIIKADAGTYGMGIMTVYEPEDIMKLNRKERSKMSASKGKKTVSRVILQEGVYSFETLDNSVAEPVVYHIGHHVVGGFYRVHKDRGPTENLNAPGMTFSALAFAECCNNPCQADTQKPNRFYAYGVVARLAVLAAARETREVI